MDLFRALAGGNVGNPMLQFGGMPMGGPMGMGGGIDPSQPFKAIYRCRPVVMAGKEGLESGDKILLPSSALDQLARRSVTYPMNFKLEPKTATAASPAAGARSPDRAGAPYTHCGVQEFSSEEGICYIPFWMMQNLLLKTDDRIVVTNVALKKGSYVKFKPQSIKFMQLYNPRVVLEKALRSFSCLTQGDNIAIQHGSDNFFLEVAELRPAAAVSIIETDLNVDFQMSEEEIKRQTQGAGAAAAGGSSHSAAGSSSGAAAVPAVSYTGAVAQHASTNVPATQRDFSTGGWGSAGTAEEEAAAAKAAAASAGSTASTGGGGSSDYFSRLGGGNKLTSGKRKGSSASGSASSSAAPSPTLGPSVSPMPSPSPTPSLTPAARPASALGGARPQSALANRTGGYSLSGSGSSSSSAAAAAAPAASSAAPGSSSGMSLGSSASSSSLGVSAGSTKVVERQGNFDYIYEVDAAGKKRLVRRLPVKAGTPATAAGTAGASSSSAAASSSGGLLSGKGHSLK